MPPINADEIPLIDLHAHADMRISGGETRNWEGETLYRIQQQERMAYMIYLARNHREVIELADAHPDEIGAGLWINPLDAEEMTGVKTILGETHPGLRALKIHPAASGFFVSMETLDETFRLCNEHNLLLITHTGAENNEAQMFVPLLEKYPQTKLILSHTFPIHEACNVIERFENVFADTSYTVDNREAQLWLLNRLGKEKITYSVDGPFWFPKDEAGAWIPQFRIRAQTMTAWYKNDRDAIEHIYYKNAAKLLGLSL